MKSNNTNFVKAYVLIAYFIVVGLLAVYSLSPYSGEVGFILAKLTPHLVYIPLVLTALWYPQKKLAHVLIFMIIFVILAGGFIVRGWNLDIIFTIFTSFIYLWVYFAILLVPAWKAPEESADVRKGSIGREDKTSEIKAGTLKTPPLSKESSVAAAEKTPLLQNTPCEPVVPEFLQVPSEQILPLIESYRIRDPKIISNTFRALESIGPAVVPYLITALKSPSLSVKENSAKMLGILKAENSICSLIDAMDDDSKRMHNASVQALAKIGEPAVAPLFEALSDGRWRIRAGSCSCLRIIGVNGGISEIAPLLFDENHYVRKEAAKSLGRIGDESVVNDLCLALDDASRGVRLAAVTALGRIKSAESVAFLLSRYKVEADCQVRERIVDALGQIGGESAIAALKLTTLDSDPEIRSLAKEYLFGYGHYFK
ncbi:MAG: HEAT repeat domain-containing protein [Methanomicrobium sp.]|nr:HEAT repeat domain-containing protein [Methanomicrobium sp.]